jgi:hypothetical protein
MPDAYEEGGGDEAFGIQACKRDLFLADLHPDHDQGGVAYPHHGHKKEVADRFRYVDGCNSFYSHPAVRNLIGSHAQGPEKLVENDRQAGGQDVQDEFLVPDECLPASDCNDRVAPVDNVQQCNHLDQTADSGCQGGSRNTPLGEWPDTEDQKVVTDCI